MVKKKTKTAGKKCVGCKKPVSLVGSVVGWLKVKTGMAKPCVCK